MNAEGLINLSQAVAHGSSRQVRNVKTTKQGVVVDVIGEDLRVDIGLGTEVWVYEDCEELVP